MPVPRASWIVLKFGGTSVATRARWDVVATAVRAHRDAGRRVVVVCSAVSGVSDRLEALVREAVQNRHEATLEAIKARHLALAADLGVSADLLDDAFDELERLALGMSLLREAGPRLQARVMALGELMATRLGAAYLGAAGLETAWRDARQMLRAVDDPALPEARRYLAATCEAVPDAELQALLGRDRPVIVTQGFIAASEGGETVLLGRGGSDTSAAYFAARLQAERLEIWTDVPGLFTANPRQVPSARLLRRVGYLEAQELAGMGAKVLHPRCLDPVRRYSIPLHLRCTLDPAAEGTLVSDDTPEAGALVRAIAAKTGVTVVSMETLGMWQQVGFLADVFAIFKAHGLSVDLVTTSESNVTVSLDPIANALDPAALRALLRDLEGICHPRAIGPCAVVSLVGRGIRSILSELAPALEVFDDQALHMVSQAASDLNFSFVVDEDQAERLVGHLHALFFTDRRPDALFGPTWDELHPRPEAEADAPWWQRRRADLLALAEAGTPRYVYDEGTLRRVVAAVAALGLDRVFYAVKANAHPGILALFEAAGLGFECVSPGEVALVRALFPALDPARILFTPNFAPRAEYADALAAGHPVTVDNLHPLERWPEVFAGRDVLVRVDPGRGRGHHKYVRTAGATSKFGVAPHELERLAARAADAGARVVGLHAHVGSGIRRAATWAETALYLADAASEHFPDCRVLNFGGGLGVVERPGTAALDLGAVAADLARVRAARPGFELWMEPGRYLVAEAGVLLARVTQTKRKDPVFYVGLDAGMNSLIRPALYGAYHRIVNLTRLDAPATVTAEVVGPICESGDVLGHGRALPATDEGDVLLVATAGAYGRAMSSHYNRRDPAAETLLPA